MVINNLYITEAAQAPEETDPPLSIDPNMQSTLLKSEKPRWPHRGYSADQEPLIHLLRL